MCDPDRDPSRPLGLQQLLWPCPKSLKRPWNVPCYSLHVEGPQVVDLHQGPTCPPCSINGRFVGSPAAKFLQLCPNIPKQVRRDVLYTSPHLSQGRSAKPPVWIGVGVFQAYSWLQKCGIIGLVLGAWLTPVDKESHPPGWVQHM